jgi:oxalate decarboxylase/phosphoglucose isomerase-like protein (cupin superfamily)
MMTTINDCITYDFSSHEFEMAGKLSFVDNVKIPFSIERIFYIYDVPSGSSRGAHAHKELSQIIICLSGSLEVELSDGVNTKTTMLNHPSIGLFIPPLIWASEKNFSTNAVALVLASAIYKESDYLRDYDSFLGERGLK